MPPGAAGGCPAVLEFRGILATAHEEAFSFFHAMPTYPAQNTIFFNALPACFGVLHGVARAAVQQPVEAGTGAVDEIALLKQQSLDAAAWQGRAARPRR